MLYSIQGIAASLRAARKKRGLSQRELSTKSGIPQSHISKIEQGKVDLQVSSLIEVARLLELELILVPRQYLSVIQAFQSASQGSSATPAYPLPNEEEEDA